MFLFVQIAYNDCFARNVCCLFLKLMGGLQLRKAKAKFEHYLNVFLGAVWGAVLRPSNRKNLQQAKGEKRWEQVWNSENKLCVKYFVCGARIG